MKKVLLILLIVLMPMTYGAFDFSYIKVTMLNQDPDPAQQGDYLEVRWKVEKLGNEKIENLSFTLDADYPFSFDPSDTATKIVGDWQGYSDDDAFYTLYYKLRVDDNALEGSYNLSLTAHYNGITHPEIGKYAVRVGDLNQPELVLGTLQTDPVKLVSDTDAASLDVEIENIGDGNAENVKAELLLPEGFTASYSYSDRVNLGTIAAETGETATFYIDIPKDAEGKAYETSLLIEYKEADDNELKTLNIPLEIPIKNKPEFEITSVETDPESVVPGSTVSVRITVKNTGGEKGESVSLRVFKDSSQPFEFDEKSDFIGSLEPGESGDAIITLTVDQQAAQKEYSFDIEIRTIYEDDVLVQEESMNLLVNPDTEQGGSPVVGALIIFLIAVAGVGGFFFGRRKPK